LETELRHFSWREVFIGTQVIASLHKPLSRKLTVLGIASDLVVTIAPEGLSFRMKGSQKEVTATWADVIAACATPVNVPKYLNGSPFAFLQYVGEQIMNRRSKLPPKKSPAKIVRSATRAEREQSGRGA
jgi:hypothetical protein